MFLDLAKGQEDLKALITKEKKKKAKKPAGVLNMGRILRGPSKRALDLSTHQMRGIIMKKITTRGLMKMKLTTLRRNILPLMINTNSWRIALMLWRSRGYPCWILKS